MKKICLIIACSVVALSASLYFMNALTVEESIDRTILKLEKYEEKFLSMSVEEQDKKSGKYFDYIEKTAKKLNEKLDEDPNDQTKYKVISWIADNWGSPEIKKGSLEFLKANYLNDLKIIPIVKIMFLTNVPEQLDFLQYIFQNSEVKEIRAMALYCFTRAIRDDPSKLAEHEAARKHLIREYSDHMLGKRSIGDILTKKETAANRIAVGKQAPKLIGKDVNGKEIKLSDYRGQIVLIDFWGHW